MAGIEDEFLELRLLREAFPQLSLKSIVAAYNAADGTVDAAAAALEQQISAAAADQAQVQEKNVRVLALAAAGPEEIPALDGDAGDPSPPDSSPGSCRSRKWTTVARSGTVSSVRSCSGTEKKRKKKHKKKKNGNGQELERQVSSKNGEEVSNGEVRSKQEEGLLKAEEEQEEILAKQESKELEEFLLSMLGGGEVELGMDVVRDVIYECKGDGQKSLDSLLAFMSEATGVDPREDAPRLLEDFPDNDPGGVQRIYKEPKLASRKFLESDVNHLTRGKESSYQVLATEVLCQDIFDKLRTSFPSVDPKALAEVLKATNNDYRAATMYLTEAGLKPMAQEFLESVFKPPDPPRDGEDLESSDWIEVKAKPKPKTIRMPAKFDQKPPKNGQNRQELEQASAVEYWSIMRDCFIKATAAYAEGHRNLAGRLSEKAREYKQLAFEARDRESKRIFRSRNKGYTNNITIDLHDQHLDEAIRLFNLNLNALQTIASVHTLTVITGCGHHAANGKAKIKPAIISCMNRKGLKWSEINPGCLIVDLRP